MTKCKDFIKYANMIAQNQSLEVAIECVNANTHDECIKKIKSNDADLVTLDGGDVYKAGRIRILVAMIVLEAKLEARQFYAKHHAFHYLKTTLCFETTSRIPWSRRLSF